MDRLAGDRRVVTAARIADRFSLDPLTVLDTHHPDWLLRIAALAVCHADDKTRAAAARAGRRGGSAGG